MPEATQQRYVLMCLDPLHVGTGGTRLGRVDMDIVREPGTRLPKIPGTSLGGAIRQYAAYQAERPGCAGQGNHEGTKKHCGQPDCPICYTFGTARGNEGGQQGTVSLFDAYLLLFPVHSMAGPVWVSTVERLGEYGFGVTPPPGPPADGGEGGQPPSGREGGQAADGGDEVAATTLDGWNKPLNLGWLMLEARSGATVTPPAGWTLTEGAKAWGAVAKRIVLVTDKVFSQVVNSNLEVRTSVSIDPQTGAATEGALFTYEALPRATWLVAEAVEDDYLGKASAWAKEKNPKGWTRPLQVVTAGLKAAEMLGLGGMGTRGFGRVRLVAEQTLPQKQEASHEPVA